MAWITQNEGACVLALRVVPRASRDEVRGVQGEALKIKLRAPPVEGKANQALVAFLSEALGVSANRLAILSGETSRAKRVRVAGVTEAQIRQRLGVAG